MSLEVKVEGARELRSALRRADSTLPKEMAVIHKAIAEPVARDAARRVRSKSGRLARDVRALGTQKVARVAAGRASIPYAGPNHFGWPVGSTMRGTYAGNPFLTDAIWANRAASIQRYETMLADFLDEVGPYGLPR